VLNEHNTVFARSGPLYAAGVSLGPPESSTQTTSRSVQPFLQASLGDRPTDRPTDHATRSVTNGGAPISVIVYGCNKKQQISIGTVDSNTQCMPFLCITDRPCYAVSKE